MRYFTVLKSPANSEIADEAESERPKVQSHPGLALLDGNGPLTPHQLTLALEAFRDERIRPTMPEWEAHSSILRPAMIETFVQQRVVDADDWLNRVPQFLRTATNPVEKRTFFEAICEIVDRLSAPMPGPTREQSKSTLNSSPAIAIASAAGEATNSYSPTDVSAVAIPERERFYDPDYGATLRKIIAEVIALEGPIFDDVLVDRIARAHGM